MEKSACVNLSTVACVVGRWKFSLGAFFFFFFFLVGVRWKSLNYSETFCYCPEEDPHVSCLLSAGSLGMFSALRTADGFRQRFGRPSPVLASRMCQCRAARRIFIEQIQGSKEIRGKKMKLRMYKIVYSTVCMYRKNKQDKPPFVSFFLMSGYFYPRIKTS